MSTQYSLGRFTATQDPCKARFVLRQDYKFGKTQFLCAPFFKLGGHANIYMFYVPYFLQKLGGHVPSPPHSTNEHAATSTRSAFEFQWYCCCKLRIVTALQSCQMLSDTYVIMYISITGQYNLQVDLNICTNSVGIQFQIFCIHT